MFLSSVPALDRCQIVDRDLFDPLLTPTYKKLPRLPRYSTDYTIPHFSHILFRRMADYTPAWGQPCNLGGFQFSKVLEHYESPDVE